MPTAHHIARWEYPAHTPPLPSSPPLPFSRPQPLPTPLAPPQVCRQDTAAAGRARGGGRARGSGGAGKKSTLDDACWSCNDEIVVTTEKAPVPTAAASRALEDVDTGSTFKVRVAVGLCSCVYLRWRRRVLGVPAGRDESVAWVDCLLPSGLDLRTHEAVKQHTGGTIEHGKVVTPVGTWRPAHKPTNQQQPRPGQQQTCLLPKKPPTSQR